MIRFLVFVLVTLLSFPVLAQSTPNFTYGQVPTVAQWNSYFAAKEDVLGYTPVNRAGDTMTGVLNVPGLKATVASSVTTNSATLPAAPTGTVLQLGGADTTSTRELIDAFGTGVSPTLTMRSARGTAASPSAVQSGDAISAVNVRAYGATGYSSSHRAGETVTASENWSDTAQGTKYCISTTKNGTVLTNNTLCVDGVGHLAPGLGTAPTVSSCGTGSPTVASGSTDVAGRLTEGTSAAGCTLTFANAFATAPFCTVTSQTQLAAFAFTVSTSAITITNTSTSGDVIAWVCMGQ